MKYQDEMEKVNEVCGFWYGCSSKGSEAWSGSMGDMVWISDQMTEDDFV